MKKIIFGISIIGLCVLLGYGSYLFRWNQNENAGGHFSSTPLQVQEKKEFTLFFCNNQKSDNEHIFLASLTPAQDCLHVVNQWLLRAWQRRIISSPISCQSVILDPLMITIFVSFDFSLFDDSLPICTKIHIINSLLKTIQQINISFQSVYLLVRHEPMVDKHIDWIRPFSISGYSFTSF